jgi:lipopolysaccharide assembly outer membrane protein LptD (OstA)
MKTLGLALVVAVVAAGGFVAGQSSAPQPKSIAYGPDTRIVANELRYDEAEKTVFARGAVRIVSESSTMTAEEADVHVLRSTRVATDLDIVLRGNVRVLVTPQNGALR